METNITGIYISYDNYVTIKHFEGMKIPNFKWEKNINAKLDRSFIGWRNGIPATIYDFQEGDRVKAHIKMVKYYLRKEKTEGYRLIITKLELI